MKLYIDCEFNGHGGELISMALVSEHGHKFYGAVEIDSEYVPWVAEHVIPIMGLEPVSKKLFKHILFKFLEQFESLEIIADWPADILYFCESILLEGGRMIYGGNIDMRVVRVDAESELPHNALYDAIGIMEALK